MLSQLIGFGTLGTTTDRLAFVSHVRLFASLPSVGRENNAIACGPNSGLSMRPQERNVMTRNASRRRNMHVITPETSQDLKPILPNPLTHPSSELPMIQRLLLSRSHQAGRKILGSLRIRQCSLSRTDKNRVSFFSWECRKGSGRGTHLPPDGES